MSSDAKNVWDKVRCNDDLKKSTTTVYGRCGMSLSEAVTLFMVKLVEAGGLPFDMCPESPSAMELEPYIYIPSVDKNGVPILPAEWDDDED